ncbi:copper resistance D family protein [Texcoconibacillus texcoconensis]|uniref:Putative copper resistance protein D n=1 Tax=Texcoconibacillus texcoconensis TaxID=1095777 RepID=A0A840QMM7_9BACI|nr:copper resistance D family protein [Texcoconibacillus texcoconensis]MBB5172635.1 putative copper resistance protein D [Texcoconibacillus texcoconensis]
MIAISDALLYVSFAFVFGYLILSVISEQRKPEVAMNRSYLFIAIGAIVLLAAAPAIDIVQHLMTAFQMPIFEAAITVLGDYQVGQAWMFTLVLALMLIGLLKLGFEKEKGYRPFLPLLLAVGMVFSVSWASHGASLDAIGGFLGNGMHLLAAVSWIGVLLTVSFFVKEDANWDKFLQWFTPFAIVCVSVMIASGFVLMGYIVPEYMNSWMLPYGQLLLLKHLLFIPLVFYGFAHGFLLRKKIERKPQFSPKRSFQIESVIGLAIFVVTAVMSHQTPPHEVATTLQFELPSTVATALIGDFVPGSDLQFVVFHPALLAAVAAFGLFIWLGMILKTQRRLLLAPIVTLGIVAAGYTWVIGSTETTTATVDDTVYEDVQSAVEVTQDGRQVDVLVVEEYKDGYEAVVYVVDDELLVTELVEETEDGYQRLPNATLTVGGEPVKQADHTIRTFIVRDGFWDHEDYEYTYVTLGYVQEPAETSRVEIEYEQMGNFVDVENDAFINIAHSDEAWSENHPINFMADDGTVIGEYMRMEMETGAFCH